MIDYSKALAACRPTAEWSMDGNELASLVWHGPGEPPTEAELQDAWTALQTVTGWPSVQQFLDQFSDAELATIGSNANAQVQGLLIRLNGWRDVVHADNERIQLGLALLVQLNLITESRKTEILTTAQSL